ncbi:LamG-like jellyroll fold domain-containing protein [Aquirufa antheringensis]
MKKLVFLLLVFSLNAWAQMALPVQQSVLPKNSLVVNYDFSKSASYSNGSSTLNNLAGSASGNATLVGSPNFLNSLGFMSFNGSSQYLVTSDLRNYFKGLNSSVQKSFTMSMWVFPTQLNGVIVSELNSQTPSSGWHASNIEIVNGVFKFRVWASSIAISSSIVSLNQWYHLALVYDGTKSKAYLNGTLLGTQVIDRELPTSYQHYAIASSETTFMGSGGYGGFNLAHFKLHQLPLTDSDILQEYEAKKGELDYIVHSPSTNTNPTYWSVSSAWNTALGASGASGVFGDLAYKPWLNSSLGWVAQTQNTSQFITLNYDEPALIKGLVVQPRGDGQLQWVSEANIETSLTGGEPWTRVLTNKSLNVNTTGDIYASFSTPIFAKAVKVIPTNWNDFISLRMGMLVKPNAPVTDGLVLNLDAANIKSYQGTGTTWTDLSVSSNHATISLSPTHNAATGLTFNGSTQYGRIPSVAGVTDFTNSQKYSIEVWFNPASGQANSGEAELLEKWNYTGEGKYPFTIRFNEGGSSMMVACYDGSANYPSVVATGFPVNTWKQFVGVFDFVSKTLTVYRDGVSVGSTSLVGINQVSNTSPVAIATRLTSTGGAQSGIMFKGTIGIIRFYNKPLTSAEILQNFNTYKTRYGL